jgi:hypothetical protein
MKHKEKIIQRANLTEGRWVMEKYRKERKQYKTGLKCFRVVETNPKELNTHCREYDHLSRNRNERQPLWEAMYGPTGTGWQNERWDWDSSVSNPGQLSQQIIKPIKRENWTEQTHRES